MKNHLWTQLRTRITFIKSKSGIPYNWLFIPGGPGLGSASLVDLTSLLDLPGTMWFLDLPGDGTNLVDQSPYYFARWTDALAEAADALDNVVMVAHSTGGMLVLSAPELKNRLCGLVLLDSAPSFIWQEEFALYCERNPLPKIAMWQEIYAKEPTAENLKKLTLAGLPYVFTKGGLEQGLRLFESLPYNVSAYEWSAKNFDSTYGALWVPDNMPTLIVAGKEDNITPLTYFRAEKNFQKSNILLRQISRAGHFPWIENPCEVKSVFEEFLNSLLVSHFH
jgi:pimeloyl-ACP methyl ester carboxylesterase